MSALVDTRLQTEYLIAQAVRSIASSSRSESAEGWLSVASIYGIYI